ERVLAAGQGEHVDILGRDDEIDPLSVDDAPQCVGEARVYRRRHYIVPIGRGLLQNEAIRVIPDNEDSAGVPLPETRAEIVGPPASCAAHEKSSLHWPAPLSLSTVRRARPCRA